MKGRMSLLESKEFLRIGDLARLTGVTVATLRYYETENLIECVRTNSRYRMFSQNMVIVVKRIVHLRSLNVSLLEIRQILQGTAGKRTFQDQAELQRRLDHILEQKTLWEEQERQVRSMLDSLREDRADV